MYLELLLMMPSSNLSLLSTALYIYIYIYISRVLYTPLLCTLRPLMTQTIELHPKTQTLETKRSSTKPMFSKDYEQVEQLLMDESVNIDTDG